MQWMTMDLSKKGMQEIKQDTKQDIQNTNDKVASVITSVDAAHQKIDHADNRITT